MAKEIPENEVIQFIGVKDLEPMEQEAVQRLTTENYQKIKRDLKNITSMKVHVKVYKKEGEQKKFALHVQAIFPGGTVESNKANDFELARAIHKAFNDIRERVHHKFHSDTTTQRPYE